MSANYGSEGVIQGPMPEKYRSEAEIHELVGAFEDGTIPRDEWRHAEHLTVALYYCCKYDLESAIIAMRNGIFRLLAAFGVDLAISMPYHETLTIFWMRAVYDFAATRNGASLLETANELVRRFDKDYPLRFYSRELLFSNDARANFVEADLG